MRWHSPFLLDARMRAYHRDMLVIARSAPQPPQPPQQPQQQQQQQHPTTAGRFDVPVGLSSQSVPYPVGELAGEAGCQPGVCSCSETSPMMGGTPYGVAARRTCPSSVTSFGRVTHAPAYSRVRTERYDGHHYICLGRRSLCSSSVCTSL